MKKGHRRPNALPPICNLPDELLWICFDKINFGANKREVWALLSSCKALKQALARYPVELALKGQWGEAQVTGICRALPMMLSLRPACDGVNCPTLHPSRSETLGVQPFLHCPSLRRLDLHWMTLQYDKCWSYPGRTRSSRVPLNAQLPQGLTYLHLPRVEIPACLGRMIDGLARLGTLRSRSTGYYPAGPSLTSLKKLQIGGGTAADHAAVPAFMANAIQHCSQLTSLSLRLGVDLADQGAAARLPSLLRLKVSGCDQFRVNSGMVNALLSRFVKLQTLKLYFKSNEVLLLKPPSTLRQLNVMGAAVDLSFLRNKKLRDLMHSKPSSSSQYRVLQRLETRNVVAMAKFSALRRLELASWLEWDDLRPLAALQLQELVCANYCMLLDILQPGCLQTLEKVKFPMKGGASLRVGVTPQRLVTAFKTDDAAFARVSAALVALPRLKTIRCCFCVDDCLQSGGVVKRLAKLHLPGWQHCRPSDGSAGHYYFRRLGGAATAVACTCCMARR